MSTRFLGNQTIRGAKREDVFKSQALMVDGQEIDIKEQAFTIEGLTPIIVTLDVNDRKVSFSLNLSNLPVLVNGQIPQSYLPSYVDDVLEFPALAQFPETGESGKIYVAENTHRAYRWSGTGYVHIKAGTVDSVNGLEGVILIKSINGQSLMGSGDITIPGTNLGSTRDANVYTITSSTGNSTNIESATNLLAGLLSSTDKAKLDTVEQNANNYTHPTNDGSLHVPATGTTNEGRFLVAGATAGSFSWVNVTPGTIGAANSTHSHDLATTTTDGFMSASDKVKIESVPRCVAVSLTATQANTTVTEAILNGFTFTIPPGKSATIKAIMIFTAAATTTGGFLGIRVSQGAGANGNAVGSWNAYVNLSSAATATGLSDGDVINIAGGATSAAGAGVLGTATVAGNNASSLLALLTNTSTNASTTVSIVFRSEVANSAVTAQIGTTATCIIG